MLADFFGLATGFDRRDYESINLTKKTTKKL